MESAATLQQASVSTPATNAPISAPLYSESLDSPPRSHTTEAWEGGAAEALPPVPGGPKLRLMCSYGGHIVPRPHDKSLCYVGGETRIVVVDRNSTMRELLQRISKVLLNGRLFTIKYQLPNEDLDSLITVSTDEDLENMIEEYDCLTAKSSRIRLFLFPVKLEVAASMGPILDGSNKSDDWFTNGADLLQRGFSEPYAVNLDLNSNEGKGKVGNQSSPDVLDSSSSFDSASSTPAMANLPRIRVHVQEGSGRVRARVFGPRIGNEDQLIGLQKLEEGFAVMSSPPSNLPAPAAPVSVSGEYTNSQQQNQQINEDLPSPTSVSSDSSSLSNATANQKPVIYQDPSGNNRAPKIAYTDSSCQAQQLSDSGYVLQQAQQQQQFIHASNHYVQHHPNNGVPLSYYPVYPQQHQVDQRYHPVYYVPVQQQQQPNYTEAANMTQTQPQATNPSYTTIRNIPPPKSDIPQTGMYMTGNPANPQLIQMPQQQFMGYSQIQHPSQSMTPASAAAYAYELPMAPTMVMSDASIPSDNVKSQIRTSQPL